MQNNLEAYTFEKGEFTDFSPENQPKGSYRKAVNFIRNDDGQLISEKGTTLIFGFPEDLEPIGKYNLNGELIFFLTNQSEEISEIGILSPNNQYVPYITNRTSSGALLELSSNLLNFSFSSPIDVEARKLFNGNRIIYFVDGINDNRRINLDNLPSSIRFAEEISLQFDFLIPKISLNSIESTGALPTGIYQFGVRYLTSGGNTTNVGIVSNPIKIVDENQSSGRTEVDGNIPQSSSTKSITLDISNLDSNYPFIEIIAITYIGIANIEEYSIIGRLENTGNNISFTYRDSSQVLANNLILEEITTQPVLYTSAKHIAQKDGILFLGNLQETDTNFNLQDLANRVQLEYFIEEVQYNENIRIEVDGNLWQPTGPITANEGFTYQRSVKDVGVLTISFDDYKSEFIASTKVSYMRGEVYSFALVPKSKKGLRGFAYHIPGNNTFSTPANVVTKRLGTYVSSEVYKENQGLPSGNIRHHRMPTAAQEPIFRTNGNQIFIRLLGIKIRIPNLTEQEIDFLQGIDIVRESRNSVQNRSIICQGISKKTYQHNNEYLSNIPSYGKCTLSGTTGTFNNNNINPNVFSFDSPDLIHGLIDTNLSFQGIQRVARYTGIRKWDSRGTVQDNGTFNFITFNNVLNEAEQPIIPLIQNYKKINSFTAKQDPTTILNNPAEFLGFTLPFSTFSYRMRASAGTYLFSTVNANTLPVIFNQEEDYFTRSASNPETYTIFQENPTIELLCLRNDLADQYGQLENSNYILCSSIIIGEDILPITTEQTFSFYGGDTYINKYALLLNENVSGENRTIETKSLLYFFLESIGNYNFRHYVEPQIQDNTIEAGSLPYYPKFKTIQSPDSPIGLIDYTANLGHSQGYNKQYSFENSIISYIPKPLLFEEQQFFPNRVIRSELTFEGEIADNYRIFLPNNFQDVPKDKGEMTNLFIWNDTLMVHTERGLFQTYVNKREQILTDVSQIVIGTGGVFSQPPKELFDIEGGYLGTTSKWATVTTPFGYFFLVNSRGKIFSLTDKPNEISDLGKFDFFEKNINIYNDSPLQNIGYVAGFDYLNKRLLLTKLGNNSFTYSFFTKLNSWTGSHSYSPNWYIERDKNLILYKDFKLYTLNTGKIANYFDLEFSNLEIELSLNSPKFNKVYDNLKVVANIRKENIIKPLDFFNKISAYTIDQNSSELELIVSQQINPALLSNEKKVSYKNREYRISYPLDAVTNNLQDIFDRDNINLEKKFKGRMQGEYSILNFKKDNLIEDITIYLNYIVLAFRNKNI